VANAEIEFGVEEALGGVVVGIDDDGGEVESLALSEMGAADIRTTPTERKAIMQTTRSMEPPRMKDGV